MNQSKLTKSKNLTISDIGDHYKGNIVPMVRLSGKWLLSSGFSPGNKIKVTNPYKGKLILECLD